MKTIINKKLLPQYSTPRLKVYTVNQTGVCGQLSIKFVGGGHHLVFDFIPKGEIWVAEHFNPLERKYWVYHELFEHRKMSMGLPYEVVHVQANKVEGKARQGTEAEIDELIKKEMERNKEFIFESSHFNNTKSLHAGGALHHTHHRRHPERRCKSLSVVKL